MPRGDRTGPDGKGSRTGRKLGFCSGYDKAGSENQSVGRGFLRRGNRNGNGFGRRQNPIQTTKDVEKNE